MGSVTRLSLAFDSPKGTYRVAYDPQEPMALDMHFNGEFVRCHVFIDEIDRDRGHIVCGLALHGSVYWFELRLQPPRQIAFYGTGVLDHLAVEAEESN